MPKVALTGGFYVARGIIANCQRELNLYPEKNADDAESPVTHYPTPGLTLLGNAAGVSCWRGFYLASNGKLYGVCGSKVFYIDSGFALHLLGTIPNATTPVGMIDNTIQLLLVDGTAQAYTIVLATNVMSPVADINWPGKVDTVDYIDGFIIGNVAGTRTYFSTLNNQITPLDPLYIAGKDTDPDNLVTLCTMHREFWLLGEQHTEVWYDAGNPTFPFAIIPGVYVEQGCAAKYSAVQHDLAIFWLGQNRDGQKVVIMGQGYIAKRISTHAIEQEIDQYGDVSDAQGFIYTQQGHVFYVLTFPTANKTWVYDITTNLWHERAWIDGDGNEHRVRMNFATLAYGKIVGGDWENGNLYSWDLGVFTDNGDPIVRRRGFPHAVNDGNRMTYRAFAADMQAGEVPNAPPGSAIVFLRWSNDRGKTWSSPVGQSFGDTGQYLSQPQWQRLGMARDRVFELFWSTPAFTALNGAWVDTVPWGT